MRAGTYLWITFVGLSVAFATVSAAVWLTRGNRWWVARKLKLGGLLLALSAASGGCATTSQPACYSPLPPQDYPFPEWVTAGTRAARGETPAFSAVGKSDGTKHPQVARQAAEEKARAAMAELLDRFLAALEPEPLPETARGALAERVRMATYWRPNTGSELYGLAYLELPELVTVLAEQRQLDAAGASALETRAEAAFDELVTALEAEREGGSAPTPLEPTADGDGSVAAPSDASEPQTISPDTGE